MHSSSFDDVSRSCRLLITDQVRDDVELLVPLEMSANALAIRLRLPAPRMSDLVREKRGVSVDATLRLARLFNISPEFWLNLQTAYA